jgi:hypothetical protein
MPLPELPLTPTGEVATMWTIVLVCDGCKTMLTDLPEVRAESEEEAGRISRHNSKARGWTPIDSPLAGDVDLCPSCAELGEQLGERL